jgi:hypothetical protein
MYRLSIVREARKTMATISKSIMMDRSLTRNNQFGIAESIVFSLVNKTMLQIQSFTYYSTCQMARNGVQRETENRRTFCRKHFNRW